MTEPTTPGPAGRDAPAGPVHDGDSGVIAEAAWLGCLLRLDHLTACGHLAVVDAQDLADPKHRIVLEAIRQLVLDDEPVDPDPVLVLGQITRTGTPWPSGSNPGGFLIDLAAAAPAVASAEHYARIVRENSWRRRVIAAGVRLQQIGGADISISDLWGMVKDELEATLTDAGRNGQRAIA